jgi:hypothetical protein
MKNLPANSGNILLHAFPQNYHPLRAEAAISFAFEPQQKARSIAGQIPKDAFTGRTHGNLGNRTRYL